MELLTAHGTSARGSARRGVQKDRWVVGGKIVFWGKGPSICRFGADDPRKRKKEPSEGASQGALPLNVPIRRSRGEET